ncbi:Uncharacterized protein HZ326_20619 [Fusarium oxysporum f. sp. albedinis]|nr:Uncharacterized protein HZ326_20619 [Fusarium oxysporum f. sp. albedinis]
MWNLLLAFRVDRNGGDTEMVEARESETSTQKKAPANTESPTNPSLRVDLRLASHPSKEGVGQYLISGRSH